MKRLVWVALIAASCSEAIDNAVNVSVAPESRAERVVFALSSSPLMYGLSVLPCGSDRAVWVISQQGPGVPPPTQVVYGEVPEGYTARTPAAPLRPGCYRVVVSGPESLRFIVNADGTVRTPSRDSSAAR